MSIISLKFCKGGIWPKKSVGDKIYKKFQGAIWGFCTIILRLRLWLGVSSAVLCETGAASTGRSETICVSSSVFLLAPSSNQNSSWEFRHNFSTVSLSKSWNNFAVKFALKHDLMILQMKMIVSFFRINIFTICELVITWIIGSLDLSQCHESSGPALEKL